MKDRRDLNSFKPYYKWITFNTDDQETRYSEAVSFKPYYKWITFNTLILQLAKVYIYKVLNLIINGLPSILLFNYYFMMQL